MPPTTVSLQRKKIQPASYSVHEVSCFFFFFRIAGNLGDVVLGYDTVAEYVVRSIHRSLHGWMYTVLCETETVDNVQNGSAYFGGLIGRVANRIAGARFVLDGKAYRLYRNDGNNSLHGDSYTHGCMLRVRGSADCSERAEAASCYVF